VNNIGLLGSIFAQMVQKPEIFVKKPSRKQPKQPASDARLLAVGQTALVKKQRRDAEYCNVINQHPYCTAAIVAEKLIIAVDTANRRIRDLRVEKLVEPQSHLKVNPVTGRKYKHGFEWQLTSKGKAFLLAQQMKDKQ